MDVAAKEPEAPSKSYDLNFTKDVIPMHVFAELLKVWDHVNGPFVIHMCSRAYSLRVCDEYNYGSYQGRCVIYGGLGISNAYYFKECTQQKKDRDCCPKIVNLRSAFKYSLPGQWIRWSK